jgi:predicted transcriptional regulator
LAKDREAQELIALIQANLARISDSKARAAELIASAKTRKVVSLKRIARETGLSEGWVKKVAKTGQWPER